MSKLTEQQKKDLKDVFDLFDADKSGTISLKELKNMLMKLGLNPSDKDVVALMKLMDKDKSGSADFPEFCNVMALHFIKTHPNAKKEYEDAFKLYDTDNSGFITEQELFKAMSKFKAGVKKEDIKKMMRAADKDSDGKITLDEFIILMTS